MTTFQITLKAKPGSPAIRQLRWLLKSLARQYGLTCTSAEEIKSPQTNPHQGAPAQPAKARGVPHPT